VNEAPAAGLDVILQSILCPVDFSNYSQQALRWALALAARHRCRLIVLTAVDSLLFEAARARLNVDLAQAETEPALREFVEAVIPSGASWAPEIAYDVRVGNAADVILEAADRHAADLVAMGTQGLGGFRKLLLGSTTECVLRMARTPVLTVPPHAPQSSVVLDPGAARLEPGRVLVATDFSDTSLAAVRWAADAARDMKVPLVLAHAVGRVIVPPQWQALTAEFHEARVTDARAKLEQLSVQFCGGQACEIVVSVGRPVDVIAAVADDREAGLIVMGLTSEGGPGVPRPGSIAYGLLCIARVPVVVVPPNSPAAQA
jgi:nucleotide-binding universal stress UspA family protein